MTKKPSESLRQSIKNVLDDLERFGTSIPGKRISQCEAIEAILQAIRSEVPEEAVKEDGLCECEFLQCFHAPYNACRQAMLDKLA